LADAGAAILFAGRAPHLSFRRSASAARCRPWTRRGPKRRQGGLKEWPGINIVFGGARIGASWANWYESLFKCGGQLVADTICVKDLDAKFEQYVASVKPAERKQLAEEIQGGILENYYLVPVFRHAFMNAIGPRIAALAGRISELHQHRLRLSVGGDQAQSVGGPLEAGGWLQPRRDARNFGYLDSA
jgi:hypothetical protein